MLTQLLLKTSFRQQLTFAVTLGVLCAALLASAASSWQGSQQIRHMLEQQGLRNAESLAQQSHLALLYNAPSNANVAVRSVLDFPDAIGVGIHHTDGRALLVKGKQANFISKTQSVPSLHGRSAFLESEDSQEWHFIAPVAVASDEISPFSTGEKAVEILGYVRLVQSKASLRGVMLEVFSTNLVVALVISLALLLLINYLTNRLTRPLKQLSQVMAQAEQGEYTNYKEQDGPTDIQEMGRAFNRMMRVLAEREHELRRSEQRMQAILDNSAALIYMRDTVGRYLLVNREFERVLKLTRHQVLGKTLYDLHKPEIATVIEANDKQVLASLQAAQFDERIMLEDGERFFLVTKFALQDTDGHAYALCAIATDITERHHAEDEIRQLNQDLEQRVLKRTEELESAKRAAEMANDAKSIFLANMSHEIRTPLNAVLGYAQLLIRDPRLTPELQSIATPIEKSGLHLLNLINDILDLSKIEAGRMSLEQEDFDLCEMLHELAGMFALRCEQKGIGWQYLPPQSQHLYVNGDIGKLRQVLLNLLSNAMKFTDRGNVRLQVVQDGQEILFEVADSGPGIPLEQQELVFAPFHQTEIGSKKGGTGLGLAISSRQVQLMGGKLHLQSQPGRGSRFYFSLQMAAASQQCSISNLQEDIPGLHLIRDLTALVVDDIEENRDVLSRLLRGLGAEVVEAENGLQALAQMEMREFDLVMLDIRMPVMDGVETLQAIHQRFCSRPVCIAITASALLHEKESYLAHGFDDFIGKPFVFSTIYRCLQKHLDKYFENITPPPSSENSLPQDWQQLILPHALYQQIMQALESGWLSGLEQQLTQMAALGEMERAFASHLQVYLSQYDMDGVRKEMEKIRHDA